MDIRDTLKQLCGQTAPSGFEFYAADTAKELLAPFVDEVRTDRAGNVLGLRRCGKPGAKKLLLDAHLDEVGLIVTGIEEGFLRFRTIGGVDPRVLIDREMTVLTQPPIFGVVSCLAPHVQKAGDSDRAADIDRLMLDIGMTQEEAQRRVSIGTPIVYRQSSFCLGEGGFCGKSLDDRSCFAAVLRALELLRDRPLDVDLCILGSAGEEMGGWGAMTAAYGGAPDYCVAVDVTFARQPGVSGEEISCVLGGGPAIGVSPVIPRWMSARLRELAQAEKIPFQMEIMSGRTGTNGDDFQIAREGIATAVVSLPLRYMHTPIEAIHIEDAEQTARLLASFALSLGKEAGEQW